MPGSRETAERARAGRRGGPYGDELVQQLREASRAGGEVEPGAPNAGVPHPPRPGVPESFALATQANNRSAAEIVKVRYTHQAMADLIIANPWMSQGELARHFGYSEGWVCRVIASDAFQAYLATRKDELIDPTIRATVEERFRGLVVQSIEKLQKRLEAPNASDDLLLGVMNGAAKALGYGARAASAQVTVQNFVAVVPQKDASSAAWAERVAQRTEGGQETPSPLQEPSE